MKKVIEIICGLSLLLAVMGCENEDGSPNFKFIVPCLSVTAISGLILNKMEGKKSNGRVC